MARTRRTPPLQRGTAGTPEGWMSTVQSWGIRRAGSTSNRAWLALGISMWGLRMLRRLAARNVDVLLREELKPGERILITALPAPGDQRDR